VLNALGIEDFGIYNVVGGVISMLGFLEGALSTSTQRFFSYSEGTGNIEKLKSIFNVSIILHSILSLIILVILIIAGFFFFSDILKIPEDKISSAKIIYICLIVSTVFSVMSSPYEAILNSHENMLYYSIIGVFESILKLIVAIIIIYIDKDKLVAYGFFMAIIPIIILTIMRIYSHNKYDECVFNPQKYFDKALLKEMTSFAGLTFLNSTSSLITMQGTSILLNNFFGVIVNASHSIANQISGQLMVFSNGMLKAINPIIVKSEGASNRYLSNKVALSGNKLSFILLALFAMPFIFEMPFMLRIWLKVVPDFSVIFARLILIRTLISQLYVTLPISIGATGKIKNYVIFDSIIWILPLPIGYFLYNINFPVYVIYLLLILLVLQRMINSVYFAVKLCDLDYKMYLKEIIFKAIALILFSFVILYIPHLILKPSVLRTILTFLIGGIFISSFSFFFYLNKQEKEILMKSIIKILKK